MGLFMLMASPPWSWHVSQVSALHQQQYCVGTSPAVLTAARLTFRKHVEIWAWMHWITLSCGRLECSQRKRKMNDCSQRTRRRRHNGNGKTEPLVLNQTSLLYGFWRILNQLYMIEIHLFVRDNMYLYMTILCGIFVNFIELGSLKLPSSY